MRTPGSCEVSQRSSEELLYADGNVVYHMPTPAYQRR